MWCMVMTLLRADLCEWYAKACRMTAKFCFLVTLSLSLCAALGCFLEPVRYCNVVTFIQPLQINSKGFQDASQVSGDFKPCWPLPCFVIMCFLNSFVWILIYFIGDVYWADSDGIRYIPIDLPKCEKTQLSYEGIFWKYLLKRPNE